MQLPDDSQVGQCGARAASCRGKTSGVEGLLDMPQAAKYLATSERHLRRLWQERRITSIKVGRRVRFARLDLDAYIEANRQRALR
jgi:excisionase family DNA binding protein